MKPTVIVETHEDWALTPMEMKVVGFMWQGLSVNEIARKMNLGYHSIGRYMSLIYRKFGIPPRRYRDGQRGEFHKIVGFHERET